MTPLASLLLLLSAPPAQAQELLYFALVDRFADGQPDPAGTTDRADPQAWHGGDLAGIQAHLDHLSALGVTRLWLSPVFHSRQDKFHGHGAFHGYWVQDLDRIEARLGGRRALRRLARAAQQADLGLVLDMVYNHVSFDSPLLEQRPAWFHTAESISDWNDPVQLVTGQVHGLPDLAQEREPVYRYLRDRSLRWARVADASGFRVDAVRHLPLDFLHRLSADLKARLGDDFWLLGEDFQGDPVALSQSFRAGGFDAMFDFPLRYAMIDVFCHDQPVGRLGSILSLDRLYDDPGGLVTFLDNHDLPRVASECGEDPRRVEAALLFQFAQRGIPAITYGTEWMLTGAGEPENRADIPWDQPPVLADTIRQLQALRREHPILSAPLPRRYRLEDGVLSATISTPKEGLAVLVNGGDRDVISVLDGVTRWAVAGRAPLATGTGTPPPLAPGAVGVYLHAPYPDADPVPVTVTLEAAVEGVGGEVLAVGAGPELGNWDPARGVRLVQDAAGAWQGSVTLPSGSIAEWKVVQRAADGAVAWEPGANRYLSVVPR